MAVERIQFSVVGVKQYSRGFEMAADEAKDLSIPLAKIGKSLISSVHENFRTEGAHGATKWKRLSAPYASWKQQQVGDEPILVFKGTMRAAMINPNSLQITPRRLKYEPDVPDYAILHQEGGEIEGRPPQRKMVQLPMEVRHSWDAIFVSWLNDLRAGPIGFEGRWV